MNLKLTIVALIVCSMVISLQPAAAATDPLQSGIGCYNSTNYLKALQFLLAATQKNPRDPTAHYYLANTLARLDQREQSLEEYKVAYSLAPAGSDMSAYCVQALSANSPQQQFNNRQLIRQMVGQIREQVNSREQVIDQEMRAQTMSAVYSGQSRAAQVQARAAADVAYLRSNPLVFSTGRGIRYVQRNGEIQDVQNRAMADAQFAMFDGQRRAGAARNEAANRQLAIETAAAGLESQCLQPGAGGVRLNPLGTNLYVRNYGYEGSSVSSPLDHPDSEVVPLVASAGHLNLPKGKSGIRAAHDTTSKDQSPLSADAGKLASSPAAGDSFGNDQAARPAGSDSFQQQVKTEVHGQVLKP